MKKFEMPEIMIEKFGIVDVIATSTGDDFGEEENGGGWA